MENDTNNQNNLNNVQSNTPEASSQPLIQSDNDSSNLPQPQIKPIESTATISETIPNPNISSDQTPEDTQPNSPTTPKKKKIWVKILAITGIIALLLIIVAVVIFVLFFNNSKKLVCESSEGNFTILYNDKELIGYTTVNGDFNLEEQNKIAKEIGVEKYLSEFNNWFTKNTTGSCSIDGKKMEPNDPSSNTNQDQNPNSDSSNNASLKTVGEETYGYVTVPNDWVKFYDIDGNTALQYSLADVYIVSLDYIIPNSGLTARNYASNYLSNQQNNSDVTDVKGAQTTIGANNEYNAYMVEAYYPSDGTYLATYWFDAEDGNVHYVSIEGPKTTIQDYMFIPKSFKLNN